MQSDLVVDVDDIAQHCEQVFPDAAYHLTVDEGLRRRVAQLELDAPLLLHHLNVEVRVALHDLQAVVDHAAAVEYRQGTAPQQLVQSPETGVAQTHDLMLREHLQTALRGDERIDHLGLFGETGGQHIQG